MHLLRRYGLAVLLVGIAIALRLVLHPLIGGRYPFLLFVLAIVLAAGYCGYGPSLLAVVLSWLVVDSLFLASSANPHLFQSRSEIGFAFFSIGLVVTLLGGTLRERSKRAETSGNQMCRAFESQQAEREWLQITLASIADAVITTDPRGRVISLNPVAARLTGWSLDQAVGRPLGEVFRTVLETTLRTDDLPIARVVAEGEIILSDDEVMLIPRSGRAVSVEHNAAPIKDSRGKIKGVVIVFRDVTERHRAEQAQRESEERFRQLADHLTDVFWVLRHGRAQNSLRQPSL